jgi:crossover junction endonuclease MUS81
MIQRVNGVSAEKAVQVLGKWETPMEFWEGCKAWEREVEEENRRLEKEEELQGGKKGKAARRKVEDYVIETVEDQGTRGIKGKVGGRIWDVFMSKGRYSTA